MSHLIRGGVRLYYEVHGNGPAILLTHGFSATSQMWSGQIDTLSRNHQLILWDMRGHGNSASPPDQALYTEAATAADMAAILDAAGAVDAVIGGLSLGGYMSLAFHLAHPARTRALMIFDSGPGYKSADARRQWNENVEATARDFEIRGLDRLKSRSPEMSGSHHRTAEGLIRAARGMMAQRDARIIESLPGIAVPTLVLVGERDTPFLAAAEYMAGKIPNASKVVIPGAGHAANIDQPAAFNDAVEAFLDSL
jgi:pimeloyl-ACP methyl ester carboxylesterase